MGGENKECPHEEKYIVIRMEGPTCIKCGKKLYLEGALAGTRIKKNEQ